LLSDPECFLFDPEERQQQQRQQRHLLSVSIDSGSSVGSDSSNMVQLHIKEGNLNTVKTRIMTSTSGSSALPAIEHEYGTLIADSLRRAIVKYSVSEVPLSRAPNSHPLNPIMDPSQRHPSAKLSFQPPPLLVSPPELPTIKLPTRPSVSQWKSSPEFVF
jgi:hypothetical protein